MKMYSLFKRCEFYSKPIQDFVRYLSSAEISTALRPFYFAVHPDLFGQHPNQREVNENSLKQLSSFLTAVQSKKPIKPMIVPFYVRKKRNRGSFNLINIQLKSKDTREVILTILKACDLSTTFVNQLPPPPKSVKTETTTGNYKSDSSFVHDIFADIQIKIKKKAEETTLKNWLNKNSELAKERTDAEQPIVEEINRLKESLIETLKLRAIKWECGWNISHFRGCLEAFQSLSNHYPEILKNLEGRTIVFAPFTGVSMEGDVLLNTGDVRHNWLDLLRNVTSYDLLLTKIPSFEKAVSQVLLNIKIGRRKFMPRVMVAEYEKHLVTITTTLNDYKGLYKYPKKWPKSLENFEIVIETEAGPLTLSPTGQFIVPSSCPGFLLIDFISENLEEAKKRLEEYSRDKELEKELYILVKKELKLNGLHKDDAITPELMIACCNRLLENKNDLQNFNNLNLNITTYYSVLTNGVVCIPWNWNF